METIKNLISEYVSKSKKHYWDGSPFEPLLKLGLDERGEFGENLVNTLLKNETSLDVHWEGNKTIDREDGSIWDILISSYRTEVKTAMRGSEKDTWQHEKIVESPCWNKIIFVDLEYNGIWFTVQNHDDIPFGDSKHEILGVKSTPCKAGWKFDLSGYRISQLKNVGCSFFYDMDNVDNKGLKDFFEHHFSN
jgi:hypothetical protein